MFRKCTWKWGLQDAVVFRIRTDHEIEASRPDLSIIDKKENNFQTIDVEIPDDGRVKEKEDEKV